LAPSPSKEDRVKGDVFEGVTEQLLERLDRYEGQEYVRQLAEVTMEDGRSVTAYFYRYILPVAELAWIQSGDWNSFKAPSLGRGAFINKID
jgi:gamma-glutamylcyclotransferase (GGCT)/AIG2-like uncharacterized protein YtfP